jgi:hypothetical protein
VLERKLGWEVINLARQGCSNGGIRVQIDEVIRQRPTFAIISPSSWDRMEIPAEAAPYKNWDDRSGAKESWGPPLQQHLLDTSIGNGYDPAAGIRNVNYRGQPYNMICETIFSLAENYDHDYRPTKISKDAQLAIKSYINNLYDSKWKKQMDEWIISDGLVRLVEAGIPFSVEGGLLWLSVMDGEMRKALPAIVEDKYLRLDNSETLGYATWIHPLKDHKDDPGYHGAPASQEYIAEVYYKIMKDTWNLI